MKASERVSCPKCTFAPTFSKDWKMEYKDECYGLKKCGWSDNEVKEHLHKTCPDCGYTMACETSDYDKLKRGDKWNTAETVVAVTEGIMGANKNPGHGGMGNVKPEVQAMVNSCAANRTVTPITRPAAVRQPVTVFTSPAVTTPVKCRTCPVTADGKPITK
jgi:hypothetical protein